VSNSPLELLITTGFGILAYALRKVGIPLIPLMLAFVLARLLEDNFRRALSLSGGELDVLYSTPTSIVLWVLAVLAIVTPLVAGQVRFRTQVRGREETETAERRP
jgi:putative tricarboxylic transport membrane protein